MPTARLQTIEIYRDDSNAKQPHRWRTWTNGRNTANGGEGYARPSGALKSVVTHMGLKPGDFVPRKGAPGFYDVRRVA